MKAKYNGTCRDCGERIFKGDEIIWRKGEGARHAKCEDDGQDLPEYKAPGGMCEDAPCCGCCGPQGDGDYYGTEDDLYGPPEYETYFDQYDN